MNRQTLIIGVIVVCIILFLMSRTSAANSATPNNQPPNNQPPNNQPPNNQPPDIDGYIVSHFYGPPYLNQSCTGRNELGSYPAGTFNRNQCAQRCQYDNNCVSFETNAKGRWGKGKCQLSTTCTPSTFDSSTPSWTTYMKN